MATQNMPPSVRALGNEFLLRALGRAVQSYESYLKEGNDRTDKGFATIHANAKVCMAHIEMILKLARSNELKGETVDQAQRLLQEHGPGAKAEEAAYQDEDE